MQDDEDEDGGKRRGKKKRSRYIDDMAAEDRDAEEEDDEEHEVSSGWVLGWVGHVVSAWKTAEKLHSMTLPPSSMMLLLCRRTLTISSPMTLTLTLPVRATATISKSRRCGGASASSLDTWVLSTSCLPWPSSLCQHQKHH